MDKIKEAIEQAIKDSYKVIDITLNPFKITGYETVFEEGLPRHSFMGYPVHRDETYKNEFYLILRKDFL